jgi:hypothetical protein
VLLGAEFAETDGGLARTGRPDEHGHRAHAITSESR